MLDSSDMPPDAESIWGSVTVSADRDSVDTHVHEDGSEHSTYAITMAIENHGLPGDKFVDTLLMSAIMMMASSIDERMFSDEVPSAVREQASRMMAQHYLSQRILSDDLPGTMLAVSIPTHVDFGE